MTWCEAFRQQALSDYRVFRHLTGEAVGEGGGGADA